MGSARSCSGSCWLPPAWSGAAVCVGLGEGSLPLPVDVKARSGWRGQNRMRAAPTGSHVKHGSDTHSGPKGGLGILEGSGDIVYKSVQVPIAKRAVTGCSRFSRTRGTATGCTGRGLHLVSWCCQCAVVLQLEAPSSRSAWCWLGWTWVRPWRWQGHPW